MIREQLCPFAAQVYQKQQILYKVSQARQESELMQSLLAIWEQLAMSPAQEWDTALLIHPGVLTDFSDYLTFVDWAHTMQEELALDGIFQIATFHPVYQFAHTDLPAAENYSNRSPYPMLHILREASVSQALADYPHPENIPHRNIAHLRALGTEALALRWQQCREA